jgi:catechol 2,3-dioxygenase-like lactoylglutathione lyase family enzyme
VLLHTMVGSNDIERSKRFYDNVFVILGVGKAMPNVADSDHL